MKVNFFLARKTLNYILFAHHRKGHAIHSPFIYKLIREVFLDKTSIPALEAINAHLKTLKKDKQTIEVNDLGAGSMVHSSNKRSIASIAGTSVTPLKYRKLLFRLVEYFNFHSVLELGTSVGITAASMASARQKPLITTVEGCLQIAAVAQKTFDATNTNNCNLINSNFEDALSDLQKENQKFDMFLIDGNHTKKATIAYFEACKRLSGEFALFVFDDIYWSEGMFAAWETIRKDKAIAQSADLGKFGLAFIRNGVAKQHFKIRF